MMVCFDKADQVRHGDIFSSFFFPHVWQLVLVNMSIKVKKPLKCQTISLAYYVYKNKNTDEVWLIERVWSKTAQLNEWRSYFSSTKYSQQYLFLVHFIYGQCCHSASLGEIKENNLNIKALSVWVPSDQAGLPSSHIGSFHLASVTGTYYIRAFCDTEHHSVWQKVGNSFFFTKHIILERWTNQPMKCSLRGGCDIQSLIFK